MAFEFKMPDIGEGIYEGEIVKWFIEKGDEIEEDDVLCEIQNDKAVVEIPSPVEGTVLEVHFEEGEVATVGETLVSFDAEGYESDDSDADEAEESEESADVVAETESDDKIGRASCRERGEIEVV